MGDLRIVNPVVECLDLGPKMVMRGENEGDIILTPDQVLKGVAGMTYQNVSSTEEYLRQAEEGELDNEVIRASLAENVGAGHASMAPNIVGWFLARGNTSKMFDSCFSGAVFSNSFMPSGRRVFSPLDEIVVPKSVISAGQRAIDIYLEASKRNIETCDALMARGVSKQVASKIVHYGIAGGGEMVLPVETIVDFAIHARGQPIPAECVQIIDQLQSLAHQNGAGVTLEARKNAQRPVYPSPSIFHMNENEASYLVSENSGELLDRGVVVLDSCFSRGLEKAVLEFKKLRDKGVSSPDFLVENMNLLRDKQREIAGNYPSTHVTLAKIVPWRIWGENKRHRTLEQTAESIYFARERALSVLDSIEAGTTSSEFFYRISSLPREISKDRENFKLWYSTFRDSVRDSQELVELGVPVGDSLYIVPRALKLAVVERHNLYNLAFGGFTPVRLCSTAEPEMQDITWKAVREIEKIAPEYIRELLKPKCFAAGYCSEVAYGKRCRVVEGFVHDYSLDVHKRLKQARISGTLDNS